MSQKSVEIAKRALEALNRRDLDSYDEIRVQAAEYREIDCERVLVLAHNQGSGKTSGFDLTQIGRTAAVFRIRRGKVIEMVLYFEPARALADLGLEE